MRGQALGHGQVVRRRNELVAVLATFGTLAPGDIIFSGTPEGETILDTGDRLEGRIEGLGTLAVTIT